MQLFLAVTSATSAELIAVSSILTYDVYVVRADKCYLPRLDLLHCRNISTPMLRRIRFSVWVMLVLGEPDHNTLNVAN